MTTRILGVAACVLALATPDLSAQKLMAEGSKDLADQISASVSKEQKKKIAVLPFRELDGQPTVFGTFIAEELTTRLFTAGTLDIVERALLDKIMSELKLGVSGAIDPATAKQIGKLAGVDAIVTGSITDMPSSVAVNCRLIDVQSGRVFGAAQTRIVKDDDVKALLGKPLGTRDENPVTNGPASTGSNAIPPARTATAGAFLFELDRCGRVGADVSCTFYLTNQAQESRDVVLGRGHAFDDMGNDYKLLRIRLANRSAERRLPLDAAQSARLISIADMAGTQAPASREVSVSTRLIPAVRTPGEMLFPNVSASARSFSEIELHLYPGTAAGLGGFAVMSDAAVTVIKVRNIQLSQ